jgi:rod shape-determining protein MreD
MRWAILFFSILVLFFLQDSAAPFFSKWIYPNAALIFSLVAALELNRRDAAAAGIFTGLVLDFNSGLPDGVMIAAVLLAGAGVNFLYNQVISREHTRMMLISSIAFGVVLFHLNVWLLVQAVSLFTQEAPSMIMLPIRLLLDVAVSVLLTYPVYMYYKL